MPIRSSGCATCRKRKIRCDETRPFCRRCAVHGVACPGYRTAQPGGLEFRDITAQVARKATKDQRSESPPSHESSKALSTKLYSGPWTDSDTLKSVSLIGKDIALSHDDAIILHVNSPPGFPDGCGRAGSVGSSSSRSSSSSTSSVSSSSSSSGDNNNDSLAGVIAKSPKLPTWFNRLFPDMVQPIHPNAFTVHDTAAINSSQVYSTFLNSWLPHDDAYTDHAFLWGYLFGSETENKTLRHSLRAVSCIALGDKYGDRQLLRQGMMAYGAALTSLAASMAKKDFFPEDALLAAVSVLATCEFYKPLAREGTGWLKHIKGATQLITTRGPDTMQSTLALMVYSNARHGLLAQALITRQPCYMSKPEWRALAFRCPVVDASTYFYDLAMYIPGLLQRHDTLSANPNRTAEEVEGILQECIDVDISLNDWFDHWKPSGNDDSGSVIQAVEPIENFESFTSLVSSRAITTGFRFSTYPSGYLAGTYWCALHALRSIMQNLYQMYHALDPIGLFGNSDLAPTDAELAQYGMNLAQCIPFFCEPSTSTMGHIGIFLPMYIMSLEFRKAGDLMKLLWLKEAERAVFNRGIMPPKIPDRTGKLVFEV